jgi:hypothetical protein
MDNRPSASRAGLCGSCVHARTIVSSHGSTFYLCRLSEVDPGFPRYPRLPVLECRGYDRAPAADHDPHSENSER